MSEWKPIESAPKDGFVFLAWTDEGECRFAHWDSHKGVSAWHYTYDDYYPIAATHWMPVPEGPKSPRYELTPAGRAIAAAYKKRQEGK